MANLGEEKVRFCLGVAWDAGWSQSKHSEWLIKATQSAAV